MRKIILLFFLCSIPFVSLAQAWALFAPYLIVLAVKDLKKTWSNDYPEYEIIAPQQGTLSLADGRFMQGTVNLRKSYNKKTLLFRSSIKGGFENIGLDKIQKIAIYGTDTLLCSREDSTYYYKIPEISKALWREVIRNKEGDFVLYDCSLISNEKIGYFNRDDILIYHKGQYKRIGFWNATSKRPLIKCLNKMLKLQLEPKKFQTTTEVIIWLKNYFKQNP